MKKIILFSLLSLLLLTLTWLSAAESVAKDLSLGITRLHILANSNSASDQQLKLIVRDQLLKEAESKPEALTDPEITEICNRTLRENGSYDTVTVTRGKFYFPRKRYDTLTLPAGNYNAVRILIGKGVGENWWCVMYPPLCFTEKSLGKWDEDDLRALKASITPETFSLITESDRITVKPSFKLVELWQKIKEISNS